MKRLARNARAVALLLFVGCKPRHPATTPPESPPLADSALEAADATAATEPPVAVEPEVESPLPAPPPIAEGLAADAEFAGAAVTPASRADYRIVLPDEIPTRDADRSLQLVDQGDRASLTVFGTALPLIPGTRVAMRNGFASPMLIAPDGTHYRVVSPDELQHWFLGNSSRAGTVLAFHRTDNTVVATRGGLSLVLSTPATGDRHPLACRLFVALILGGDPAAARLGCADARIPTRVAVRARGWASLTFERGAETEADVARRSLAFPPPGAAADFTVATHAPVGRIFDDAELAQLPGRHDRRRTLAIRNGLTRESFVFFDDLAIGWLAPGSSFSIPNLTDGPHHVRLRSLDGLERSRNLPATLPATFDFDLDPNLR